MKPFIINVDKSPQVHVYDIEGYFDEHVKLPHLERVPLIRINLGKVSAINSYGIRSWCLWFKTLPSNIQVELHECPPLFVKAMNAVSGFLTANMEVISFYVPHYTVETGIGQNILYVKGKQFSAEGIKHPVATDSDKKPLELDVDDNYFKFLDVKL